MAACLARSFVGFKCDAQRFLIQVRLLLQVTPLGKTLFGVGEARIQSGGMTIVSGGLTVANGGMSVTGTTIINGAVSITSDSSNAATLDAYLPTAATAGTVIQGRLMGTGTGNLLSLYEGNNAIFQVG